MQARLPRAARGTAVAALALTAGLSAALAGPAIAGPALPSPAEPAATPTPIGGPQLGPGLAVNLVPGSKALPTSTQAKSWLVADLDTGNVLAAFNAHVQHMPASTLKTLAALALIPRVGPAVKVPFTTAELALTAQADGVSTRVGLQVGHTYPAKRLFEAMLALSANDAAEALSAAAPGGRPAVLAAMNGIAASLQARDTHAATPDGLPADGQLESAYDEALIVRAALQVKNFSAYDTTPKVTIPGKPPFGGLNHDRLQRSIPGVIGGKDGYTVASGQVWWGAAKKNGHRLVVVVMDAGAAPVTQEINLLNWGFAVDNKITPVGTLVGPVTATGQPATVNAIAAGTTPGSVANPPAAKVLPRKNGDSGPWKWVLAGLMVLAAIVLGRRHLRAAGPAAGLPAGVTPPVLIPRGVVPIPAPTAEIPPAVAPTQGAPTTTTSPPGIASQPAAEVDVAEPAPADVPTFGFAPVLGTTVLPDHRAAAILTTIPLTPEPPVHVHLRPADAPTLTPGLVSPAPAESAAEPQVQQASRRVTATDLRPRDVLATEIAELDVRGPAAAPDALEAQHDRLRTGAVKIVPRP